MRATKKIAMVLAALVLTVTGFQVESFAADSKSMEETVEMSTILTEDALIGYVQQQTRGVYLMQGYSIINDSGNGKIGAGGATSASVKCKVSINCVVERLSGGSWVRVTSWTATDTNAFNVMTSKLISVASGYCYRVRSTHYAASDVSGSCTDALWM